VKVQAAELFDLTPALSLKGEGAIGRSIRL
jgi:hypothetical protein